MATLLRPLRAPALAAAAAAAPAATARALSTSDSERVHGALRPSDVASKAMRRKLTADQVDRDRAHAPAVVQPPPPPPPPHAALAHAQARLAAAFQPPPPPPLQGAPPTFGQTMGTMVLLGFGMSLAFAVVRAVLG